MVRKTAPHNEFDLTLDIGCFHTLDAGGQIRYRDQVRRLLCPGARFMLYAFGPRQERLGEMGVTPSEVRRLFQPDFRLLRVEEGTDPRGPSAAWYWLERT